jgi:hypothetical protein
MRRVWQVLMVLTLSLTGTPVRAQSTSMGYIEGIPTRSGIKGQPYTAIRKTTSYEKLADGTTITRESMAQEARDSEGRTMHEMKPQLPGDYTGPELRHVMISDPVANVMITWSTPSKEAIVMHLPERVPRPASDATAHSAPPAAQQVVTPTGTSVVAVRTNPPQVTGLAGSVGSPNQPDRAAVSRATGLHRQIKREPLPAKSINGIYAEGVRTTITTPTGLEGNDRPMVSVQEVWTSPDLKIIVLQTSEDEHSKLHMVELTELNRTEPDPKLFQIPEGYKVREQDTHGTPVNSAP